MVINDGILYDGYPLVMTNIAMGNGPFIDGLPIQNGDFPVKWPDGIYIYYLSPSLSPRVQSQTEGEPTAPQKQCASQRAIYLYIL